MTTNVQCDMNVRNDVSKLTRMFGMTRPKLQNFFIKDSFSTSVILATTSIGTSTIIQHRSRALRHCFGPLAQREEVKYCK